MASTEHDESGAGEILALRSKGMYALPLLIFFFALATSVVAQTSSEQVARRGFYAEPAAGATWTTMEATPSFREAMTGESVSEIRSTAEGTTARVGATIGYQVVPAFSLELAMSYDPRSVSNAGRIADTCGSVDENGNWIGTPFPNTADESYTIAVDYFSLGFHARLALGPIFAFGGPTVSFPLEESITERLDIGERCVYWLGTSDETSVVSASLWEGRAALRVSITGGLGAVVPVARGISIVPRVSYDLPLGGTFASRTMLVYRRPRSSSDRYFNADIDEDLRLRSLTATLGVRIELSRALR